VYQYQVLIFTIRNAYDLPDAHRVINNIPLLTILTEGEDAAAIVMQYKEEDKEVRKCCKDNKQKWFDNKAIEAQHAAQIGDTKTIYRIVKELSRSHMCRPPIKLVNGKSASTHEQQIERWKQHFLAVLNCPEPDITHDFDNDAPFIAELDVCIEPITESEVAKAVHRLKNGKAAGADQIQPELLKYSTAIIPLLTKLCNDILQTKTVQSEWRNWTIISLPKKVI